MYYDSCSKSRDEMLIAAIAGAASAGECGGGAGRSSSGGSVLFGSSGPEQEQPEDPESRFTQTPRQPAGAEGHR